MRYKQACLDRWFCKSENVDRVVDELRDYWFNDHYKKAGYVLMVTNGDNVLLTHTKTMVIGVTNRDSGEKCVVVNTFKEVQ